MRPQLRKLQPNVISLYESLSIAFFEDLFFQNVKLPERFYLTPTQTETIIIYL